MPNGKSTSNKALRCALIEAIPNPLATRKEIGKVTIDRFGHKIGFSRHAGRASLRRQEYSKQQNMRRRLLDASCHILYVCHRLLPSTVESESTSFRRFAAVEPNMFTPSGVGRKRGSNWLWMLVVRYVLSARSKQL